MTDRRITTPADLDRIDFHKADGLVPVVAQDATDGRVLMVAWATRAALEHTLETGDMHYWSRSRRALWRKGEGSGAFQRLRSLHADCDGDTVLALVDPAGPACHTGEATCFGHGTDADGADPDVLLELDGVVARRAAERPEGSYTVRLLDDANLRLKKLGEETAELVAALATGDAERSIEEAADLLYHLVAALRGAGLGWGQVLAALEGRRG